MIDQFVIQQVISDSMTDISPGLGRSAKRKPLTSTIAKHIRAVFLVCDWLVRKKEC